MTESPPPARNRSSAGGAESLVLRATGMTKSFAGKLAVDHVDIDLRTSRIHALLGENGAGKSTLISMLTGQYRPEAGRIVVHGRDVNFRSPKDSLRAGIGVVHQDFRLVPAFTVEENVVLGTRSSKGRATEARIRELCAQLHFDLPLATPVRDLVVGQQQQAEIVKMLFRGLDILILDEPTAVLTPQQADQLFVALRTIAESGKSVVFVSHRLAEVAVVADHITVLRAGRVVADQSAAELQAHDLARLMVGDESMGTIPTPSPREPGEPMLDLQGALCGDGHRNSLNGADITLRAGEIVGVAGVSGNGQRLLADVCAGISHLSGGTRTCNAESVAYIPEDRLGTGLVGSMSIAHNLAMRQYRKPGVMNPAWISPRRLKAHAEPQIIEFKIPADPSTLAGALSGGGQQRVISARELSEDPDLVIAAQPTRGLDIVSAQGIRNRLMSVRNRGGSVLVISEDLDELLQICDRIVVMVSGRVIGDVPRHEASRTVLGTLMTGGSADIEGPA